MYICTYTYILNHCMRNLNNKEGLDIFPSLRCDVEIHLPVHEKYRRSFNDPLSRV